MNGLWDFYPEGREPKHDIRVPSFWDAPQDYGYPEEWLHMRHGVYRKTFSVPKSMRGKQIFLRIGRISVIAKVFVNGQQVGATDSGGYLMMQLPYLIDITRQIECDTDNHLEVFVWGGKSMIHGSDSQDNLMETVLEITYLSSVGIEIDSARLPIPPIVARFAQAFHFDPLRMISSGTLVATVPDKCLSSVQEALNETRTPFAIVGRVTAERGVSVIGDGSVTSYSNLQAEQDELARLWSLYLRGASQ